MFYVLCTRIFNFLFHPCLLCLRFFLTLVSVELHAGKQVPVSENPAFLVLQQGFEPWVLRLAHYHLFQNSACAEFGVQGRILFCLNIEKAGTRFRETCFSGAPAGIRTLDTRLKRAVLYLLSYWGIFIFEYSWDGGTRTHYIGVKVRCVTITLHPKICYKSRSDMPTFNFYMGWDMGLEPTTPGTTIRCSAN